MSIAMPDTRSETAAHELLAAGNKLKARRLALETGRALEARQLLAAACANLAAARIALDPDNTHQTVQELCTAFSAYLPNSGRTLALHLIAWDLKAWPQQQG